MNNASRMLPINTCAVWKRLKGGWNLVSMRMESCLHEELPAPTELEEGLRNRVLLAKLGHCFAPKIVPLKKIYDLDQERFKGMGLQFRHTDIINYWRSTMAGIGLPTMFHPETTDIYDKKNMPRTVYCIHALSLYLFRLDMAPQIHDLCGKVKFTVHAAIIAINEVVERGHVEVIAQALRNPSAMLTNLQEHLMPVYQEILHGHRRRLSPTPRQTVRALMDPDAHLPDVYPFASALYQSELAPLQRQSPQGDLQQEELYVAVEMLSAVALINQAVEAKDVGAFCATLVNPAAGLADIDDSLVQSWVSSTTLLTILSCLCSLVADLYTLINSFAICLRYFEELGDQRRKAGRALLTWNDLQRGLNFVNAAAQEEHDQILAIWLINQALCRGDHQKTLAALLLPSSGLEEVTTLNARRYHDVLTRARRQKAEENRDPGAELWLADIQEGVRRANYDTQRALKMSLGLAAVNQAVKEGKASQTLRVLRLPEVALRSGVAECAGTYQAELTALLGAKSVGGDNRSPWLKTKTEDSPYYFHLHKLEGTWERPQGFVQSTVFLAHEEIQAVLSSVTAAHSREVHWKASEGLVVQLQARALLRQRLGARLHFLNSQLPAVITIQSHWRRFVQQRGYSISTRTGGLWSGPV